MARVRPVAYPSSMRIASILVVATCMACSASTTADGSSPSRGDADGEVPVDPEIRLFNGDEPDVVACK